MEKAGEGNARGVRTGLLVPKATARSPSGRKQLRNAGKVQNCGNEGNRLSAWTGTNPVPIVCRQQLSRATHEQFSEDT